MADLANQNVDYPDGSVKTKGCRNRRSKINQPFINILKPIPGIGQVAKGIESIHSDKTTVSAPKPGSIANPFNWMTAGLSVANLAKKGITGKGKKKNQMIDRINGGVKIHGLWCGPSYTAGKHIAAIDTPDSAWDEVGATDKLDQACKLHDWNCKQDNAKFGDCSQKTDQKLINAAHEIATSSKYPKTLRAKGS